MYPETVSVNHEAYYTYPRRIETCIHDFLRTYQSGEDFAGVLTTIPSEKIVDKYLKKGKRFAMN